MNKNIFCLITIIVIILLIDLVFNFSKPLFRVSEGFDNNTSMKSLVNSLDGTTVSIEKIGQTNSYYIPIFDEDDRVLGLDTNNELVISDKILANAWTLRKFDETDAVLNNEITDLKTGDNPIIPANEELKSDQFYLLTQESRHPIKRGNFAIQYNRNSLIATPLRLAVNSYYRNLNLWILSDSPGPTKELILRDIKQSYLGPVKYSGAIDGPDKINIKLNLKDERLKQLLNLNNDAGGKPTGTEPEQCDNWLSKDAVKSLCPGCV